MIPCLVRAQCITNHECNFWSRTKIWHPQTFWMVVSKFMVHEICYHSCRRHCHFHTCHTFYTVCISETSFWLFVLAGTINKNFSCANNNFCPCKQVPRVIWNFRRKIKSVRVSNRLENMLPLYIWIMYIATKFIILKKYDSGFVNLTQWKKLLLMFHIYLNASQYDYTLFSFTLSSCLK